MLTGMDVPRALRGDAVIPPDSPPPAESRPINILQEAERITANDRR